MLSECCRRFRAAYQAGREVEHLEHCRDCREWADAAPRLPSYGADLPLPARLRERLLALPETGIAQAPLPQLAMPPGLRRRLVAIPQQQRSLPVWLTKARYAVAASLILAFLSVSALGDTLARGRETAAAINRQVVEGQEKAAGYLDQLEQRLQTTGQQGRTALDRLEEGTRDRSRHVKSKVRTSLTTLAGYWDSFVDRTNELLTEGLQQNTIPAEQPLRREKETDHGTRSSDPTE